MPEERYEATGRRKTSVARVRLHPGQGTIYVNGRAVAEYLRRDSLEMILVQPLELTETRTAFDIHISTRGGGLRGQAGAARLPWLGKLHQQAPRSRGGASNPVSN